MTDKVVALIRVVETDFLIVEELVVPLEFQSSSLIFSQSLALLMFCGQDYESYLIHCHIA